MNHQLPVRCKLKLLGMPSKTALYKGQNRGMYPFAIPNLFLPLPGTLKVARAEAAILNYRHPISKGDKTERVPKPTTGPHPYLLLWQKRNKPLVQEFNSSFLLYATLQDPNWYTVKGHNSPIVSKANLRSGLFIMTFLLHPLLLHPVQTQVKVNG